eukprot:TRINITY_DN3392_c0_g1_i12.p1 TRINITY_DN3392_c0_g1~~TRINITY_DN3392_c0_g1_i12.p1  ORF type:complete len:193 (+),score=31.51 TRINITY_DN3392_c0_g1_i12:787-1365(+)
MRLVQRPRPMEVWASQQCLHALRGVYGYLMPGPSRAKSFTADLVWNKIPAQENTSTTTPEFQVHGLWIQPVPVVHGPGFCSLGFAFGEFEKRFVYLSDVSSLPTESSRMLKSWKIETLVLDCLLPDRSTASHLGLPEVLKLVRELGPKRTLLVGMSHLMEHEEWNQKLGLLLQDEGIDVQLAYDGMSMEVDL